MEAYNTTEIIKTLKEKRINFFSLADFERLFNIKNRHTLYKKTQRLEKKKIIQRLIKGKYLFFLHRINDFAIANYIYQPSYISLESALSFYSILPQFPYQITSISPKKTHIVEAQGKELAYFHIKSALFFGYEKKENFLIALPEKAFIDYLYFTSKGLRDGSLDEFDLSIIKKEVMVSLLSLAKNKSLTNLVMAKIL